MIRKAFTTYRETAMIRMHRFKAIVLAAVFLSPGVNAQSDDLDDPYKTFDQFDRDHNGLLDEDELNTYGDNEEGKPASYHPRGERVLQQLDTNDDGMVSKREFQEQGETVDADPDWW
jgi:hypothetical protein